MKFLTRQPRTTTSCGCHTSTRSHSYDRVHRPRHTAFSYHDRSLDQSRTGQYILIRCDGSSTSEITAELAQYEYSRQNCIQWVSSVGSYQKSSDCIATRVPVLARHSESVVAIRTCIQNPIKLQSLDVLTRPHYTGISTFYLVHCTKII